MSYVVRGYRKCLFDLIDEITGHDLYKFSSTKTPKLELIKCKVTEEELRSRSPPGPRDFISSARRRQFSKMYGGEEQNELVERF